MRGSIARGGSARRLVAILAVAAAVLIPVAAGPAAAANEPGTLDPSFGAGGIVTGPFGSLADVVVQPDGKILVAGRDAAGGYLARYLPDGTPDPSFGAGGSVSSTAVSEFSGLAVQSNGKIVVVGYTGVGVDSSCGPAIFRQDLDAVVARFDANGAPDGTFGTGGVMRIARPASRDYGNDVVVQTDGKIVVVGSSEAFGPPDCSVDYLPGAVMVVRLGTTGVPDGSFGAGGTALAQLSSGFDSAFGVGLQTDGKILIAGTYGRDSLAVARFTSTGALDTAAFNNPSGFVTVATPGTFDEAWDVAQRPDGTIVFAGEDQDRFGIGRLTATGAFDPAFGGTGYVIVDVEAVGSGGRGGRAMVLQPDGKVVAAGAAGLNSDPTGGDLALVRLGTGGFPDPTLGGDGKIRTDVSGLDDDGYGVALQSDGKIVVVGRDGNQRTLVARYLGVSNLPGKTGGPDIDTSAVIGTTGGGGLASPDLECIWTLPNMWRAFQGRNDVGSWLADEAARQTGSPEFPRVGQLPSYWMTYAWADPSGTWWYDDAPDQVSEPACSGDPASYPGLPSHVIQVYANTGDATGPGPDGVYGTGDDENRGTASNPIGERLLEVWAAVDPPGADLSDIQQVYWDVYHPDGTKKAQVHDRVGYGAEMCRAGYTNFLGAGEAVEFDPTSFEIAQEDSVFGAAVGTTQMSEQAAESIVSACSQQQKKLYRSHFTLSKHQPCGEYRVVAHAVPVIGPEDTLTHYFDVYCFVHLDLDYASIAWSEVNTTGVAYLEGDFDMATPSLPTAINAGSGAMGLRVEFLPMESYEDLAGNPLTGKWIEDFDLQFGVSESSLTAATDPTSGDPVIRTDQNSPQTGVRASLPTLPGTTLCANETGKFIYSLHTEGTLPGRYAGVVTVSAFRFSPEWCLNTAPVDLGNPIGPRGVWGGYHDHGPDGQPDGGGPAGAPVAPGNFDDDYGRNQRFVDNP
jgi:uncharacterized delta-60 repeat protein